MDCDKCGVPLKVLNSRKRPGRVYRRRVCPGCGHRCTSAEFLLPEGIRTFHTLEEYIHEQAMLKGRQMIAKDLKDRLAPYLHPEIGHDSTKEGPHSDYDTDPAVSGGGDGL